MAFGGETVTGSGGSAHSENLCTDLCDHWDFCEGAMDDPAVYTFLGTKSCWAFNVCDGGTPWTSDGGPENCQSNALRFIDTDADSEVNQGLVAVDEGKCSYQTTIQVWIYPESSIISPGTLIQKGNASADIEWAIEFAPQFGGEGITVVFSLSTDGTTTTPREGTGINPKY